MVRDLKNFTDSLNSKENSVLNDTIMISPDAEKAKTKPTSIFKDSGSTLSILQMNYVKMSPIINELYKSLVREDGEDTLVDNEYPLSNSDEDIDKPHPNLTSDLIFKPSSVESDSFDNTQVEHITITSKKTSERSIDMRNMLGFMNQNLYHDYLNITNIMKLKRL